MVLSHPKALCVLAFASLATSAFAQKLYSPIPASRPVVLVDHYHRSPPKTQLGSYLVTGSYADNYGRYGINDFSHANGYDAFFNALEEEFALVQHESAFTAETLRGADIVVIINPDDAQTAPEEPVISDQEINALADFVQEGGSLLLLLNAVGKAGEDFESVQTRKLMQRFGLDWHPTNTWYSDIAIGPRHNYFYDIAVAHYGAGSTVKILERAQKPEVLLNVYQDNGAPEVSGPGLVLVRSGKGKVLFMGDTGSWGGGNMSRPWAENRKFLVQMFRNLKKDQGVPMPTYAVGQTLRYNVVSSQVQVIPSTHPMVNAPQPHTRIFQPRAKTQIPYSDATGSLELSCTGIADDGVRKLSARLHEFRRFDEPPVKLNPDEEVTLEITRQGSIASVETKGDTAHWMAPDIGGLVGFVPNNAIRIGDRWAKQHQIRIHPLRAAELAATRPAELEMVYLRDEKIGGRDCRVIRTQTEAWLSDLNVKVADIVPIEYSRTWAGGGLELMAGRGGKLLFKREQWLDRETGVVVKSHTQSRIIVWVHRIGEPLPLTTADKDGRLFFSLAHVVTFTLKP